MDLPKLDCAGCTTCCRGDDIYLMRQDDPAQYRTVLRRDGRIALAKGADGNCVYLGQGGCTIHGRAPAMCRTFDCRAYFLALERRPRLLEGRLASPATRETVLEGRRRVAALRAAA